MGKSQITIDSLKVRIPINEVMVVNASLNGHKYVVDKETDEIEREFRDSRMRVSVDGITTSFAIEKQVNSNQKLREYLVLMFNSKILESRYMEGITLDNVKLVYDRIIANKVVYFSWESFLAGECTDVDIKRDVSVQDITKVIQVMRRNSKTHSELGKGCNVFESKTNKGIEFGERKKATPSYPYLKVYHKGLELLNKSSEFYNKHVSSKEFKLDNLVRVEATIKNRKHFRKHQIEDTTFSNVLKLSQSKLEEIIERAVTIHLEKRVTVVHKHENELSPNDAMLLWTLRNFIAQGMNYNTLRENMVNVIECKQARTRKRKVLDGLYESYVKGSKDDIVAEEIGEFFDAIGWK